MTEDENVNEVKYVDVVRTQENNKFKGCEFESGSMCFSPKIDNHDGNEFVEFINSFNHDVPKQHRKTSCGLCY